MKRAALAIEDGTFVEGEGFGAEGYVEGELVFNTSMTGYVEALTDPSYAGQILMMTYPLIGNYGVCEEDFESDGVKVEGFVVRELCRKPSNWRYTKNLDEFLKEYNVPGVEGIDTRALTRKTRVYGAMKAVLAVGDYDREKMLRRAVEQPSITEIDLVDRVCVREPKRIGEGGKYEIVLIDCGIKLSIVRQLLKRDMNVILVPYNYPPEMIRDLNPDGVFISNGPGDPARVKPTIEAIRVLAGEFPMAGICLGNQLVALALGGKTFKLKFGHRGANQPVKDFETGRVFISSQNHGFAVDERSLEGTGLEVTQINLNDHTVEGMVHKDVPLITVQYHPEAGPGPHDTYFFFDRFYKMVREH
jgi:carbamoyl-phosphate synthase small subunit